MRRRGSALSNARSVSVRLQPLQDEGGCQRQVGSPPKEGVFSVIDEPEIGERARYEGDEGRHLTLEVLQLGFNHFKEGGCQRLRRGEIIRVDLTNLFKGRKSLSANSIDEKTAGPTGNVLMTDANQV